MSEHDDYVDRALALRVSITELPPGGNFPVGKFLKTLGEGLDVETVDEPVSSVGGAVFITNVVPTGSGSVTDKVYVDGVVLAELTTDTDLVTVSVTAFTGPNHYKPEVTVNTVAISNFSRNSDGTWSGSVAIDLGAETSIRCVHADGATYSAAVNYASALEVSDLKFTGGYPGTQTELKAGDAFQVFVSANKNIDHVSVQNFEAAAAAEFDVTPGASATITIAVAGRGSGTISNQTVKLKVRTASGQWSELYLASTFHPGSDGEGVVQLNNDVPVVSVIAQGNISYPGAQAALKAAEAAAVAHTVAFPTGTGSVAYSSPNGDLTISNPTTYETSKSVSRLAGSYNIATTNFRIVATKTSNAATTTRDAVVYIANTACTLAVTEASARLRSGGNAGTAAQNHVVTVTASQRLLSAPSLVAPVGAWQGGGFAGGPTAWTRSLQIHDNDAKGVQAWGAISGTNLAGIETTAITGDANYTLGGFVSRTMTIAAWPNREGAIGTQVSNTAKLTCNVIEADVFTFKASIVNESRKFTITEPTGVYNAAGNLWYNCDQENAVANTSGSLQVVLEEVV